VHHDPFDRQIIYNVELPEKTKVIYVDYLLKEEHLKKIQNFFIEKQRNRLCGVVLRSFHFKDYKEKYHGIF